MRGMLVTRQSKPSLRGANGDVAIQRENFGYILNRAFVLFRPERPPVRVKPRNAV
jgi:hypothetical protein